MVELKEYKLKDLFTIKQGYAFKSNKYLEKGKYRLCTLGNITEDNRFKFNDSKAKYYSDDFPHEFILNTGDLIIPLTEQTYGLFGNTAIIPETKTYKFVLNQRVGKIVENDKIVDKQYLHHLLATNIIKTQIESTATGTTQRNISPDKIAEVKAFLPDLPTQKKIADVLSCIDDKIALNNKTNTELENMAKTVYDYWFTQFDFPDKNGTPYKTCGGQMVYNETLKRDIPAGWEVGKLGIYLENFGDGIHGTPEYDDFGEYFFINGNNLGNKLINYNADTLKVNVEEYVKIQRPLNENTILLSINGTLGSISFYNGEKIAIGKSACFLNIKEKELKPFIYQILCSEKFQKYMYTVASGSTIKNFAPKQAADFDIPIPPKNLLKQFNNTTYLYLENQIKNEKENKELTKLRDYLLPLLMNGQIEVK